MKAKNELEKLNQAEKELEARREVLTVALKEATDARSAVILDSVMAGREPEAPDAKLATLPADLAAVEAALKVLGERRRDTERRAGYEQVEDLRRFASEALKRAEQHQGRVDALLGQLKALEGGTDFAPVERIGNPRPESARLRREAADLKSKADALQRKLDLEPQVAAEEAAREARFASIEPDQPYRAVAEAKGAFAATTAPSFDEDAIDDPGAVDDALH